MSIPYDPSPPLVTPAQLLAERCARQGVDPEDLALPPILIGTFQGASYLHLITDTGAIPPIARSDGTAIDTGTSIGELPRSGQAVAVARLPGGAPAAAMALEAAIARGVRCALVIGSAGSLRSDLPLGSTVIVTEAVREEGTSYHYLPAGEEVGADPEIVSVLEQSAQAVGLNSVLGPSWTTDAPFRETVGAIARHRRHGAKVVEMEASAIFAVSQVRAIRAGLLVAVSDELFNSWRPGFHRDAYLNSLIKGVDAAIEAAERLTTRNQDHSDRRTGGSNREP